MSPLEINTKIAEIKGLKIMLSPKDQNGLYVEAKIGGTIPYLKTTNWAENISDAFELFEENQEVYLKKMNYTDGTIVYQCVFRDSNLNVLGNATADTAPMAIALAWLVWKGNK